MSERLFGRHAVRESLRAGKRAHRKLWLAEGARDVPILAEIAQLAQTHKLPVAHAPREHIERMAPHSHGVVLETGPYVYSGVEDILDHARAQQQAPFVLMLDTLQDPQNLGTLVRAADATGVHGIIIAQHRSAELTPAAVHASSGAAEHMRIVQAVNLARAIDALKEADVWVYALDGGPGAQPLHSARLTGGLCLIVGNEGEGVRRLLRDKSDAVLALPMLGRVESLNAAVAGSVALYEALRQRSGNPIPPAPFPKPG
jgi:23S rRNA (guanosine2251-2'-O)-methyltransferase